MAVTKTTSGRSASRGAGAGSRATKRSASPAAARRAAPRPAPRTAAGSASATRRVAAAKPAAARPVVAESTPNAIGAWHQHLEYTSHDMPGIRRFYGEILGFANTSEEPKTGHLSVRTTPTTSLGFMAPMPGPPEQWRPPGEPALYFFVQDVDRAHRELVKKGVSFQQPPTDMPSGRRMAICRDPEGRMVCIAQDRSSE